MAFALLDTALRWLVLAALAYGAVVALTHWAVRSRRLQPFGAWPRFVRRTSDPLLRPIETRIVRFGRNPQDAPLWLLGAIVVAGLLLISLVRWLGGWWVQLRYLAAAGPAAWLPVIVVGVFNLLQLAIFIRVIASWFGVSEYRPWMRPLVLLTDWIIVPLRRVLPTVGPFDISPIAAYLLLGYVLEPLALTLLTWL